MFNFSFIPSKVHAIIDYVVAVVLFFAPELFGFAHLGGPAVTIPKVLGVTILLLALLTRHELGLFKIIPLRVHLIVDMAASLFLAASPFLFGFADDPINVWMPHLLAGLAYFAISALTESPSPVETHHHATA